MAVLQFLQRWEALYIQVYLTNTHARPSLALDYYPLLSSLQVGQGFRANSNAQLLLQAVQTGKHFAPITQIQLRCNIADRVRRPRMKHQTQVLSAAHIGLYDNCMVLCWGDRRPTDVRAYTWSECKPSSWQYHNAVVQQCHSQSPESPPTLPRPYTKSIPSSNRKPHPNPPSLNRVLSPKPSKGLRSVWKPPQAQIASPSDTWARGATPDPTRAQASATHPCQPKRPSPWPRAAPEKAATGPPVWRLVFLGGGLEVGDKS